MGTGPSTKLKAIIIGCCYRPLNAALKYLDGMCVFIDKVPDENEEFLMFGDINVEYLSPKCNLTKMLLSVVNTSYLTQVVNFMTRVLLIRLNRSYLYQCS